MSFPVATKSKVMFSIAAALHQHCASAAAKQEVIARRVKCQSGAYLERKTTTVEPTGPLRVPLPVPALLMEP